MRARLAWWSLVAVALAPLLVVRASPAQDTPAQPAPSASASPSASAEPSVRPATGYGWSDHKSRGAAHPHRHVRHHAVKRAGPVATMPGFELLGDGGSRFFVQLTQQVPVESHKAKGKLTYVLKGAHVDRRNNLNPLVTVHFNTPVTRARLVPAGKNLNFVLELRADVTPTYKVVPGKDGTSLLVIDFPKGKYLPNAAVAAVTATGDAKDAAKVDGHR